MQTAALSMIDLNMNIIVKPYGTERCCCRPDTSWEREDRDLFVPDFISGYSWTPVLFARISKAGKCIGRKFASRYYDAIGYGILLYADDMLDGSPEGFACASCMDHTSVLPFPMYDKVTLESGQNIFSVAVDDREIYSTCEGSAGMIEDALAAASGMVSLRIGDLAVMELAPIAGLVRRETSGQAQENGTEISGTFCGNELFRFKIIM